MREHGHLRYSCIHLARGRGCAQVCECAAITPAMYAPGLRRGVCSPLIAYSDGILAHWQRKGGRGLQRRDERDNRIATQCV